MQRRTTTDLRHAARALIKEAIWLATNNHRPGGRPDIALFASRRGASTWLMELLATSPGVKALDQPVEIATGNLTPGQARRIPKFHLGQIIHLDVITEPMVRAYLDDVLAGVVPVNAPVRFWRPEFHLRTDRLLLKILGAKSIAPWIEDNYHVDVVYLMRHPVAQSLSCLRNRWTLTLPAYLDSSWFVSNYVGSHEGYCRDVMSRGPTIESFVLNWVCENLVMLRLDRPTWTRVNYEDLVLDPAPEVDRLAAALRLEDVDAIKSRISTASVSSGLSTAGQRAAIARGDRRHLLDSWREQIDADELSRAYGVLDRFEIDAYRDAR